MRRDKGTGERKNQEPKGTRGQRVEPLLFLFTRHENTRMTSFVSTATKYCCMYQMYKHVPHSSKTKTLYLGVSHVLSLEIFGSPVTWHYSNSRHIV